MDERTSFFFEFLDGFSKTSTDRYHAARRNVSKQQQQNIYAIIRHLLLFPSFSQLIPLSGATFEFRFFEIMIRHFLLALVPLLCCLSKVTSLDVRSFRPSSFDKMIPPIIPTARPCRRAAFNHLGKLITTPIIASAVIQSPQKVYAADDSSSSSSSPQVPLLGRFEPLVGAKSFIGNWKYEGSVGPSEGQLVFLKNGDVELRSLKDSSILLGVGAVPWKYVSAKKDNTIVTVSFTIDGTDGQDDVLIFQGTLDSAGGPNRIMKGTIETGRAEIGARGSGPRQSVGTFTAQFMQD